FPRFLFLLLLALNVGGACWIALAPPAAAEPEPLVRADVARLVLLSERDGAGSGPGMPGDPRPGATSVDDACRSIGRSATRSSMRSAMRATGPLGRRVQYRNARSRQSCGCWVYLPAVNSREEALAVARTSSSKGVRAYYVVTAGEQQNTVSLGL